MFNWNDSLVINEFDGLATMVMDGREVGERIPCRIILGPSGWRPDREVTVGPAPAPGSAFLRIVGLDNPGQFVETDDYLVPEKGTITLHGHRDLRQNEE